MQIDVLTIGALAEELETRITGGKIDRVNMPRPDLILLQIHTRSENLRLVLSCGSGARCCITEKKYENPAEPPMLCMLLRKQLLGGRIVSVKRMGLERIIGIEIMSQTELGDPAPKTLYWEMVGQRHNILLVDSEGIITAAVKKYGPESWPERPIMPGLRWRMPPTRDRISLKDADIPILCREAFERPDPAAYICSVAAELSPKVSRRLVELSGGDADALAEIISGIKAEPWVIKKDGIPADFLPVRPVGDAELAPSFSEAIEACCSAAESEAGHKNLTGSLLKVMEQARKRTVRRLANQKNELESAKSREELKRNADLIMSNLWNIRSGDSFAEVTDYFAEGMPTVRINLDPELSPQQNAQELYKKYTRLRNAQEALEKVIAAGEEELYYIESVLYSIGAASGNAEISQIKHELIQQGYMKMQGSSKPQPLPKQKPIESPSGFAVTYGRNNRENDEVRRAASSGDLWFHVKNVPGSHVILHTGGAEASGEDIEFAAALAASNSAAKTGGKVAVDYCPVKNVKKIPGAAPGMVNYTKYNTVIAKSNKQ